MGTKKNRTALIATKGYWDARRYGPIKRQREYLVSDERFANVKTGPEPIPEFSIDVEEEDLLSAEEVMSLLKTNQLRRAFLDLRDNQILESSVFRGPINDELYWSFIMLCCEFYESRGEDYVNDVLEPLGYKQEHYYSIKRRIRR